MPFDIVAPFVSLASAAFGLGRKRKRVQIDLPPPPSAPPLQPRVKQPEPRYVLEPEFERVQQPGHWWDDPITGFQHFTPGAVTFRPTGQMVRRELPPITTGAPLPELPVPVAPPPQPHALEKRLTGATDVEPPPRNLPQTDVPCIPLCAAACAPRAPLDPDERVARALARARAAAARARADRCRLTVIVQGNRVRRVK